MSVSSPLPPPAAVVVAPGAPAWPTSAEIDRSCRAPVLTLFGAGVIWLLLGAVLGVIAAIKMHGPGFLAGVEWLTYGRVQSASLNAFVYGFVLQAGWGVALWMTCRLGRNRIQGAIGIIAGTALWNLGLVVGIALILGGASTGQPWLEMPRMATPILFLGYLLVAAWGLVTLHVRRERRLYVSQWFILASWLWFPWTYATAQVLSVYFPVRGVMQAIVTGWYARNFYEICLASLGLASVFYFLPKLLRRPLSGAYSALFGFWLLALLGGWGGLTPGQPVPNWLTSVSVVSRALLIVAVLAFGASWSTTRWGPGPKASQEPLLRFTVAAAASYFVAAFVKLFSVLPHADAVTIFTVVGQGIDQLRIHGFLNLALAGAIYYIAPRLAGVNWPSPGLIRAHFLCAAIGVAASFLSLLIGGVVEGTNLQNPQVDFLSIMRGTVPFLGTNTLGMTFLLVGYFIFAVHLGRLLTVNCPCAGAMDFVRRSIATTPVPEKRRAKA